MLNVKIANVHCCKIIECHKRTHVRAIPKAALSVEGKKHYLSITTRQN